MWDNPTMTLTADSKKRVVLPGAAPGDVFTCEQKGPEMVLRRVYREAPRKKLTKAQALKGDPKLESIAWRRSGKNCGSHHAGTLILLDTNVIIDAHDGVGITAFYTWSNR